MWPSGEDVQPSEAQTISIIGKPRCTKTLQMSANLHIDCVRCFCPSVSDLFQQRLTSGAPAFVCGVWGFPKFEAENTEGRVREFAKYCGVGFPNRC